MKQIVARFIILFFDILHVVMIAFAIGFIRHFFFDFNLSDLLIATALYSGFRFYHYRKNRGKERQPVVARRAILVWLYLFLLIALPTALVWVKKTFPVQNPDLTIMTLQMPVDGFILVFVQDLLEKVGFYALLLSLALLWPVYDLFHDLRFRKSIFAATFAVILIAGSAPFWSAISSRALDQYINYFLNEPEELHPSKFYQENFVHYKPDMVSADDTTRNLIFIYVESLENSFIQHIPEIRDLYNSGLVFTDKKGYGGGTNIIGASTTISSMVSKTTGMPLLCGSSFMNNFGETQMSFFDSLPGIYDILHQFNYRNFYVQGTPAKFGATGPFFLAHGIDELYDKDDIEKMLKDRGETYRRKGPGLADADVLDYAKMILDTLSNQPFSMTITTIDTHFPNGFLDKRCGEKLKNPSGQEHYAAVLRCTSKRIGQFVQWVQSQPFGNNTEIVIAGDHLFMAKSPVSKMMQRDRRFLNIYINPKNSSEQTKRRYTSLDSGPTVLETMGFHIEGHRLGFGTSLLSQEKTLIEAAPRGLLVRHLRELSGSIEYNNLFKNKAP